MSRPFTIIPAIDLMDGKAVRLSQGDFDQKTVYSDDPLELAKQFEAAGVRRLHLVDLDGARAGQLRNLPVLERIASGTQLEIDFGGGIGTRDELAAVLNAGARMVAVGSVAVKKPELFREWVEEFNAAAIFLGTDVKNNLLAVKGWTEITQTSIFDFLETQRKLGINRIFCTDISRDGMLQGPSVELYKQLLETFPRLELIASGGVSTIDDVHQLQQCGCSGVIIGKAIYENRIRLKELEPYLP